MHKILLTILFISASVVSAFADGQMLDLKRLAAALQFPYENLKVEDYLEAEKGMHAVVKVHNAFKKFKPVAPENVLLAYKITSNEPYTFFPIIITVVKKGSYYTPEIVKLIEDTSRAPEVSYLQGGRLPFGDFAIRDQQKAFLYMREILLPAEPMQYDFDPPGVTRMMGGWPSLMPATISILQVENSDVEIKVSMQYTFPNGEELKKVAGGEVYHLNFSDLDSKEALTESNDPSVIILPKLFKALNEVALDAPALAQYRKDLPQERKVESPPNLSTSKPPEPVPEKNELTISKAPGEQIAKNKQPEKSHLTAWLIGLLVVLFGIIGYALLRKKSA